MATDWVPIAIGAGAAIGGALVGAWAQGRVQQRLERQRRRERAAEVLADVTALLDEADPWRVKQWHGGTADDAMKPFEDRRDKLRVKLVALAASQPSRRRRRMIRQLDVAVAVSLKSTRSLLESMWDRKERTVSMDTVEHAHLEAKRVLAKLVDKL
jgi:hypothetical protein